MKIYAGFVLIVGGSCRVVCWRSWNELEFLLVGSCVFRGCKVLQDCVEVLDGGEAEGGLVCGGIGFGFDSSDWEWWGG